MCEPLCAPLRKLQISQEGTKKSHRPGCLASSLLHGLGLRGIDAVELLLQALLEGVVYILVVPSSVIPFLLPLLHIRIPIRALPVRLVEFLKLVLLVEGDFGLFLCRHCHGKTEVSGQMQRNVWDTGSP